MSVPVIAIVGNSESGKTTLIEKLVPELNKRGYRVGSIKHAREIDKWQGKDSQRHLSAGSEETILAGPDQVILFKTTEEPKIEEICQMFDSSLDLILCEGFKRTDLPKIEVYRKGFGPLLSDLKGVFAVVSDEKLDVKTRQFKNTDVGIIVDLLEKGFIKPNLKWLDLYVNGKQVPLTVFPRKFIYEIVLAMTNSLNGIEPVKTLEIKLKNN
jgi:molybdopterin-guanine dinucleotide biosynthesis adapter protein